MSDADRHRRISSLFLAACELPPDERAALLGRECADDRELREAVERLLVRHADTSGFLAESALGVVAHAHDGGAAPEPLGPGSVIGRYKLLQQIGEGGFGTVYMAQQQEPVRRRVALKILKLGMNSTQVIARFEAEQQALALMDHPNIAKVLDAGITENGRPYFVMELIKGEPITTYCDRNHVPTRERLRAFIEVCQAVQHAHQKGVIHRDLKPSNILMAMSDGRPVPRVIDFGIAKALNRELTDKTLFTEFHQFLGTPQYMSPEQAEMTSNDIDTRSDIYSLGVLLYELLTGTTPFDSRRLRGAGFEEILRIIREEEPDKPSTRLDHLRTTGATSKEGDSSIRSIADHRQSEPASLCRLMHGDLDWIVMKCLEKDRIRRYETADGLSRDIGRYLSDETVSAGPPRATYRLRKFFRRNRVAVAVTGLVAVSLVLGIIGTSWQAQRATLAESRTARELTRANEVMRILKEMIATLQPEKSLGADITLLKDMLDQVAARLNDDEVKDEGVAAELHAFIGIVYAKLGLYEEAERHLPLARETYARLRGEEHSDTVNVKESLANLYSAQGRFAEAEVLYQEVIEISQRVWGAENPGAFGAQHNLANLFMNNGRYADAEPLYLKALALGKDVLDAEDRRVLGTMVDLATLYRLQGRYDEAETLALETRTIMLRALGKQDPWTLNCMWSLAVLYQRQSRYAEAEALYLEVLEVGKRVLLAEHPDQLSRMSRLAALYKDQGRYAEAEALYLEVLEIRERVLDPDHPSTLGTRHNLAGVYLLQGRDADAEPLLVQALEGKRRELGDTHHSTLNSMDSLALLYTHQDRLAEAEALYLEVLEVGKRVLRADHPSQLSCMVRLATLYQAQGRYAEAEALYAQVLDARKRDLGEEDKLTLNVMNDLAYLYMLQRRFDEAEALYLQTLETRKRVLGPEDKDTLGTFTNLGNLYNAMLRFDDARRMLETSLPAKRRVLPPEHPWTRIASHGLATAYEGLGLWAEALSVREQLVKLTRDAFGAEAVITIREMIGLAAAYEDLDRPAEALSLRRDVLDWRIRRARATNADAGTLNGAAWPLLTHDHEELRDPPLALQFALRAVELSESRDPGMLDTLALARHLTGDTAGAAELQRACLQLLPPDASPDAVAYHEAELARYEAALSGNGEDTNEED